MSNRRVVIAEIRLLLLTLLVSAGLGLLLGSLPVGLVVGLSMIMVLWTLQFRRILQWLERPETEPPEGKGVWGLIFDTIYRVQRRSEEAQFRLASALDYIQDSLASMRDAAIIVDARGKIAWANTSAEHLLDIRFPEDRGQLLQYLIRAPQFNAYYDADDYSQPLRIPPTSEGDDCLQVEISRFGEDDRLVFVRDITENYRLEQMRRDFASNVSHELRTPLTVIKGYVDTLLDLDAFADGPLRRPLMHVNEQSQRMETLLADLLWLARIESIESQKKTDVVAVPVLLDELLLELQIGWTERDIQLQVTTSASIVGDEAELHSAFSNLTINALKYSETGPVVIRWHEDTGYPTFAVTDFGVGIAPQHLPRLTERFYRVDKSRAQSITGTGLGLAIVKHVAASHQAELTVDSQLGVGSTFSLVFSQHES